MKAYSAMGLTATYRLQRQIVLSFLFFFSLKTTSVKLKVKR